MMRSKAARKSHNFADGLCVGMNPSMMMMMMTIMYKIDIVAGCASLPMCRRICAQNE
jgi:hypothetical protein